ncbi:MAG TPA: NAD-dependent succinate-semialdehyde dehydrogenase [Brevibacterium sp.]|nr:NAD-dependent succinate-semialdehyde dehydrogenase [Brevibacterium sp.]
MNTTPDRLRALVDSLPTDLYIDGRWRSASTGDRFEVRDPATGDLLTSVADASAEDGLAALDAAERAQAGWAATSPRDRSELLRAAFDAVVARAEDFALLMTLEMGKSLAESRGEALYGAEFLRWFSEEAVRIDGGYRTAPDGRNRLLVTKRPVGPSLLITPWNFPLAMATRKVGPALAAGCTSILKPASLTPLTTLLFTQILDEVGVPAGVVNAVPTRSASRLSTPLLADRRLRKLSFTGSTEVGRRLLSQAGDNVLRTSMELGGNAPFLIFEDADLDAAVEGAMAAKFRNNGEACTAANRFFVHEDVVDEFTARVTERAAALRLGAGTADGTELGPLVDEDTRSKVHELVSDAVAHGAVVHVGGDQTPGAGFFYPATVLTGAAPDARIHREEIFGPVISIATFSEEAEAVRRANESDVGLAAYLFTRDISRGLRLIEQLEYGMVGLNAGVISTPAAPFGGVKHAGLGREGASVGIEEYLETVYVGIGDPTA